MARGREVVGTCDGTDEEAVVVWHRELAAHARAVTTTKVLCACELAHAHLHLVLPGKLLKPMGSTAQASVGQTILIRLIVEGALPTGHYCTCQVDSLLQSNDEMTVKSHTVNA